jgi:DNA mismatch repair ATPase MutS
MNDYMVLDGQTLMNLEVLETNEGGREGSLLHHVDHCSMPGGKRLMRQWLTR